MAKKKRPPLHTEYAVMDAIIRNPCSRPPLVGPTDLINFEFIQARDMPAEEPYRHFSKKMGNKPFI
ncbi:hypothetical protein A7K99_20550 [Tatumella citrea]|uniref:Uncharacterized protein n=1 Tax=Tatumella citrea TaxID=53336 RepID=A0A1Y0LQA6_TATCI|nr:hypothetical protein A7K98_20565 [Tatumella citrea]ARU99930.1 hypothetical protein A7K99_20550 [Tatumella citrea]